MQKVIVRFESEHCFVWFDPAKVVTKLIIGRIEELGFKASEDTKAKWPSD